MKCNQNTRSCLSKARSRSQDFRLKKCCRKGLMTILDKIPYIFDGVDWWLEFGTLLGLIRDKKIIDWDNDLDIGVMKESMTPLHLEEIKNKASEFGFIFTGQMYNGIFRLYFSEKNGLYCDIWAFEKKDETVMAISTWTKAKHPAYFTENKDILIFNDKYYNIPIHINEFLKKRYGPDWDLPIVGRRSYADGDLVEPDEKRRILINNTLNPPPPSVQENPKKSKY